MKKHTPMAVGLTLNRDRERLTIGLDLGDRSSYYCVLDAAGDVLLEQKVSTTPKGYEGCFRSECPDAVSHLRLGRIHRG